MKQKKTQETYNRFHFCHQNEALLYQFFLHECLICHQKLQEENLSEGLLIQVTGFSHENSQNHFEKKGHLQKLHHYYLLMMKDLKDPADPAIKKLGQALERAILSAHSCLEMVAQKSKDQTRVFQQLKREIKKIITLLFERLSAYLTNENVLFFLLRRHEQFDLIFGEPIIAKLLHSLFPRGLKEVEEKIIEKYTYKGFHHLIPIVQEKISILIQYV